jgi:outer membrane protein assembly factor BamB
MRLVPFIAFPVVVSVLLSPASAQSTAPALISTEAARQIGLERMWFTQLNVDRSRGRVAGLHMHVSSSESHTVFEIVHDGKRYVFSERDRDAFGQEIGVEGAKKKAEDKAAAIKTDLETAGKKNAPAPPVATHVVPQITLYATSQLGTLHSLDAETGQTRWTSGIGNPRFPTTAPGANDKHVGACNGSTLYVLLAKDGSQLWSRVCVGAPGAGPAMSDELAFVPMISGQLESVLLEDPKRPLRNHKSSGGTLVQPVLSYDSVAWPTDNGNLYVGMAHGTGLKFRLEAKEPIISAPAFLAPNKIFATSLDGYIYCVHENRGNVLWRFTTGEPISHSPIALGNTVYAITDRGNMFAIDAGTASEFWMTPGIRRWVAGNDKRLYCIDVRGNLAILDTATGSRLGTIDAAAVDLPYMNVQTDRLILVTTTGLVQCFRESNMPFPDVHYKMEAPKAPAKKPPPGKAGEKEKSEEPMPPAKTDPFADPFGPQGKAAPAPPAAQPPPDPFAPPK